MGEDWGKGIFSGKRLCVRHVVLSDWGVFQASTSLAVTANLVFTFLLILIN